MKKSKILSILTAIIISILTVIPTTASAASTTGITLNKSYVFVFSDLTANSKIPFVLDIAGGKTKNGTNCQLYKFNQTSSQIFKAVYVGKDKNGAYYKFVRHGTNSVLDVAGAKVANGTNIQLYNDNGTKAQQWYITPANNSSYYIRSRLNNKYVIDVKNAQKKNGTNIQLYKINYTKAQRFQFNGMNNSVTKAIVNAATEAINIASMQTNSSPKMEKTNRADDVIPKYVNIGIRSKSNYNKIINQFKVNSNPRYKVRGSSTWCNIFAADVMKAMGLGNSFSHWVNKNGKPISYNEAKKTSGALEQNVTRHLAWLKKYGSKYGWKKVSASQAQTRANSGYPTLVLNNSGSHIAVVRPETSSYKYSSKKGCVIAQAGANCVNYGNVKTYFGNLNVTYWTHD